MPTGSSSLPRTRRIAHHGMFGFTRGLGLVYMTSRHHIDPRIRTRLGLALVCVARTGFGSIAGHGPAVPTAHTTHHGLFPITEYGIRNVLAHHARHHVACTHARSLGNRTARPITAPSRRTRRPPFAVFSRRTVSESVMFATRVGLSRHLVAPRFGDTVLVSVAPMIGTDDPLRRGSSIPRTGILLQARLDPRSTLTVRTQFALALVVLVAVLPIPAVFDVATFAAGIGLPGHLLTIGIRDTVLTPIASMTGTGHPLRRGSRIHAHGFT